MTACSWKDWPEKNVLESTWPRHLQDGQHGQRDHVEKRPKNGWNSCKMAKVAKGFPLEGSTGAAPYKTEASL